jgi:prevent-host-death family protein
VDRVAGVREVKARLSHYIDVARTEGAVVITEHGRAVARLTALTTVEPKSVDDVFAELVEEGLVVAASSPRLRRIPRAIQLRAPVSLARLVRGLRR